MQRWRSLSYGRFYLAGKDDGCSNDWAGTKPRRIYVSWSKCLEFPCPFANRYAIYRLWTYNPPNDDVHGDYWNGENFSWFSQARAAPALPSLDQSETALDEGARLLRAVVRPYPAKVAGIPLTFNYDVNTGSFQFEYQNPSSTARQTFQHPDASVSRPPLESHAPLLARETEIFVPSLLARGRTLIVRGAAAYTYDESRQTLFVLQDDLGPRTVHRVFVSFDPPLDTRFQPDHFTGWGYSICLTVAVALFAYLIACRAY